MFYVTPLDGTYSLVLGHNWLTCYNSLIDWVSSSILFCLLGQDMPAPSSSPPADPTPDPSHFSDCKAPPIVMINAPAFALACCIEGSIQFSLQLCPQESTLHSTSTTPDDVDLSSVPPEYHDFTNIFNKSKASTTLHCEHDLKINLKEEASPPLDTTYSLLPSKLGSLWMFLDEHLAMGFIHSSSSMHAAPVLFIHKKDSSLRLCVDFQGLNRIMKKGCYPLPHISDLLDAPSCAKI